MNDAGKPQESSSGEEISFTEFLESTPPSVVKAVRDVCYETPISSSGSLITKIRTPELLLHCTSDVCNGSRFFRFTDGDTHIGTGIDTKLTYLHFICSNCRKNVKIFALYISVFRDGDSGKCFKFGEYPPYGPPTPSRLIRMFRDNRETFLKGRQCENHGLGIGAFVYYRRVVENQKNQILDEIIRVCRKVGASPEMIQTLEHAKNEIQFSKALASVKDAIPKALLVNGHNPLTLLHSALSGGVHEHSDERCLELAHDVRVVLVELAERLGQALKDEAELNDAVTRLLKAK
jgi:hypothetical protein